MFWFVLDSWTWSKLLFFVGEIWSSQAHLKCNDSMIFNSSFILSNIWLWIAAKMTLSKWSSSVHGFMDGHLSGWWGRSPVLWGCGHQEARRRSKKCRAFFKQKAIGKYQTILKIWMFPKIVGFTPKSSHFNRVFHYKPSILGYHHFKKHLYCWNVKRTKETNYFR